MHQLGGACRVGFRAPGPASTMSGASKDLSCPPTLTAGSPLTTIHAGQAAEMGPLAGQLQVWGSRADPPSDTDRTGALTTSTRLFVARVGDGRRTFIDQLRNGGTQRRQLLVDDVVHDGMIGVEIAMSELVAHTGNRPPANARDARQQVRIDVLDSLPDLDQSGSAGVVDDPLMQIALGQVPADGVDGFEDVGQPGRSSSTHRAMASASTLSRRNDRRDDGVPMSTLTPSSSSKSQPSSSKSRGFAIGSRSTSRSMSLSGASSPRATLPNTRTFDACRRSAAARITARRSAKSSPNGLRGANLLSMPTRVQDRSADRRCLLGPTTFA